ncbi:hypothetical protein GCM10009548_12060 [Streptomyces malaysiensis subsp. malaysiensis]
MNKENANGGGSIYQRKDGRWEGITYVLTADGTHKRRSAYGKTCDDAHDKLTRLKGRVQQRAPRRHEQTESGRLPDVLAGQRRTHQGPSGYVRRL